jgi:hypothetical protein
MKKASLFVTKMCSCLLSLSVLSLSLFDIGDCILIFFEPKRPENIDNVSVKDLMGGIK